MGRKDNKEPKTMSVPDVTNVTNVTIILRCVPKLEDLTVSTLYLASYGHPNRQPHVPALASHEDGQARPTQARRPRHI